MLMTLQVPQTQPAHSAPAALCLAPARGQKHPEARALCPGAGRDVKHDSRTLWGLPEQEGILSVMNPVCSDFSPSSGAPRQAGLAEGITEENQFTVMRRQ